MRHHLAPRLRTTSRRPVDAGGPMVPRPPPPTSSPSRSPYRAMLKLRDAGIPSHPEPIRQAQGELPELASAVEESRLTFSRPSSLARHDRGGHHRQRGAEPAETGSMTG